MTNTASIPTPSFIDDVYEIAFGDDAINRDYTHDDVLDRIRAFSDKSYLAEPDVIMPKLQDIIAAACDNNAKGSPLSHDAIEKMLLAALNGEDEA